MYCEFKTISSYTSGVPLFVLGYQTNTTLNVNNFVQYINSSTNKFVPVFFSGNNTATFPFVKDSKNKIGIKFDFKTNTYTTFVNGQLQLVKNSTYPSDKSSVLHLFSQSGNAGNIDVIKIGLQEVSDEYAKKITTL